MRSADPTALWDTIRSGLAKQLPEASFREWIAPCEPLVVKDGSLWIQVPSAAAKLWIEQQLPEEFSDALAQGGLGDLRLEFHINGAPPVLSRPSPKKPFHAAMAGAEQTVSFPHLFNRYTLDRFVVGPGSQLAFAAARAVVDSFGKAATPLSMNPLFIYGGAGLGKTHLMVGIGKGLLERDPRLRVVYLKVDNFFNELTVAIRAKNTEPMRKKYQQNDVLLLDDVQTLGKMERTQEEVFHILEHLLQHGKQIVITSDKPPQRLEGCHERLITRFKWGLTADIQPPDFETRIAILKKKLEDVDFRHVPPIPEDVLTFIAHKAKGSVRDLEGFLTRVIFQASLLGVPPSLEVAHAAFQGQSGEEPLAPVHPDRIYRMTAETFNVSFVDLMKKRSRQQAILVPRQVAMYLAREISSSPFTDIGRSFNMHHSTVMNAIDSVRDRMKRDPDFHRMVQALLNSIH
ncbi:MAG: chromosomal replication initiator protein DnaA [Holophagaceae bacterium]|uniref:Chromosomal replication initiator protein DnaA n=1 Tax=Candidatus Geothrix skivensis TaxID=2954439 RepID=A0A9D7SIH3_9BACT|nr:chromosomal replication initiator protein DnaA [Candidatus Geothrix skivensis]